MANVFLDLGTHFGQGLQQFMHAFNMDQSWIIHTFEANPTTYNKFINEYHKQVPWVIAHNKAIMDYDGRIVINIETPPGEGDTGMGTSVIGLDKWNPWDGTLRQNFQRSVEVDCINFSQFIRDNFVPEDNIIIKMDIEGAEYDVLEKMIEDETLKDYVNLLSPEWHSRFFTNADEIREREQRIVQYMAANNVRLGEWA